MISVADRLSCYTLQIHRPTDLLSSSLNYDIHHTKISVFFKRLEEICKKLTLLWEYHNAMNGLSVCSKILDTDYQIIHRSTHLSNLTKFKDKNINEQIWFFESSRDFLLLLLRMSLWNCHKQTCSKRFPILCMRWCQSNTQGL